MLWGTTANVTTSYPWMFVHIVMQKYGTRNSLVLELSGKSWPLCMGGLLCFVWGFLVMVEVMITRYL